jgi:hypothetical protein
VGPAAVDRGPDVARVIAARWWNSGRLVFDHVDPEPYTSGHFGFRTTWSHFRIQGFRVWRLSRPGVFPG